MATKLENVIDEIVATSTQAQAKLASESLSKRNTEPTISTELGSALVKTASLLKTASVSITNEDLKQFMETVRNA